MRKNTLIKKLCIVLSFCLLFSSTAYADEISNNSINEENDINASEEITAMSEDLNEAVSESAAENSIIKETPDEISDNNISEETTSINEITADNIISEGNASSTETISEDATEEPIIYIDDENLIETVNETISADVIDEDELSVSETLNNEPDNNYTDLGVETHTKEEIINFIKNHPAFFNEPVKYKTKPSITPPYAIGELSEETQQSALNMLNTIRYIAGVEANTIDKECIKYAQAGTLLNAVNNKLSHYPEKPADMDEELYKLGADGAGRSNISYGPGSLNEHILGLISDVSNAQGAGVGHRRNLLNPEINKIAFGATPENTNDPRSSLYTGVYDNLNDIGTTNKTPIVVWPAQNTPIEYFTESLDDTQNAYPLWSITCTNNEFHENWWDEEKYCDITNVKITLTRKSDNKTWNFYENSPDGFFHIAKEGYGLEGDEVPHIEFCPKEFYGVSNKNIYKDGDEFDVLVTGFGGYWGINEIHYTVNFFSTGMEHEMPETTANVNPETLNMNIGDTAQLTATLTPENDQGVYWYSRDPSIATVDQTGKVTAISSNNQPSAGVFILAIPYYAPSIYTGNCYVTVYDPNISPAPKDEESGGDPTTNPTNPSNPSESDNSIDPSPSRNAITGTYAAGSKVNIKNIYFASMNNIARYRVILEGGGSVSKIATVTSKGILNCKKAGKITIIPQIKTGKKQYEDIKDTSINVTILAKPKLKFPKPLSYINQSINAYAYLTDGWNTNGMKVVDFKSSKPSVAQIDENGKITAIGAGKTTITVYFAKKGENNCTNTVKRTATLYVKLPKFKKNVITIKANKKKTLTIANVTASMEPSWSISGNNIISCTPKLDKKKRNTGKAVIKGLTPGEATVTVMIDGKKYECKVNVM